MNTLEPKWDLLREAITIIHAIQDEFIDLEETFGQNCRPYDPPCSTTTIADPLGHLAMNKRFAREHNLKIILIPDNGNRVIRASTGNLSVPYGEIVCELFNLPVLDAILLFGTRRNRDDDTGEYGYEDFTDKQLFEKRCADYLHKHNQAFPELD